LPTFLCSLLKYFFSRSHAGAWERGKRRSAILSRSHAGAWERGKESAEQVSKEAAEEGVEQVEQKGIGITEKSKQKPRYRTLPRDKNGNPIPDVGRPHTQLGTKSGRNGDYTQAREWDYDAEGKLVPKRDIDFTDHGRPQNHPNPHQHDYIKNPTGGTPQHGPAKPLEIP
jgi:hypothetical protein